MIPTCPTHLGISIGTLESGYVHEGRTIDPSFYNDLSDDSMAKFTNIGFDCLLSLDEEICLRISKETWHQAHLMNGTNLSLGKCPLLRLNNDAWGLNELEKTLKQIEPYNSRLLAINDIRNLIHRRTVHEKIDKEGNTIHKLPNQIETNELFNHLRPCELVIRENVYSTKGEIRVPRLKQLIP
ncbi:hypothetical protein Tco_1193399 [Tanacetum coccineum]